MTIEKILTRKRSIENFEKKKIKAAIEKAAFSVNVEISKVMLVRIVNNVIRHLESKFNSNVVYVEDVQNMIEEELFRSGYFNVAKSFIAYRERHRLLRDDSNAYVDAISSVSEYVDISDWRINENANQSYSIGGMILNTSGKITANYWLKHVYSPEIGRAHLNADFHIHDLSMLTGYCAGWSLKSFLNEGFNGVPNKVESKAPKHFMSALSQMVNFLGTMQNEWAGAQAFSSFDTYLAPYVYKDKLSYEEVKQNIQQFIFNLNIPSRWGSQTPFTNLTMDWVVPKDLKEQVPLVNSEPLIENEPHLKYKDFTKEMAMINKAFLEVMTQGDAKGRVFTFPIPTYNITEDFDWHGENTDLLFEVTAKYGLPYFQNFIGSQYITNENGEKVTNSRAYKPDAVRSMCCRLQLDLNELLKRGNGLFGSAEMTGSIGVVTINAARLGYRFKDDKEGLFHETLRLMKLAKESLEIKRKVIVKNMNKGLYPFTKRYLGHLKNHFSTIGINGVNEMIRNFTNDKESLISLKGLELANEYLEFIRSHMKIFQEETGNMYNLEATPAEGTTYRFAKEDKKKYPDIIQAGFGENIYYTNSSQLPVNYTDDPFEVLDFQDELQCKYTGGTVQHIYLGERLENANVCRKMVKNIISNYRLPYITITPTFSLCQVHGYIRGEHEFCPKCDEALTLKGENINEIDINLRSSCEIWTRVMGYYRPVSQWNLGKKGEHYERQYFKADIIERGEIKKDEGIIQI
ncbi:MAG: ribonucleoside triphosphate reductase [Nanoarchaeota archaeon]|nr:ribonucleoside triphosphate reductase [Nanoarchaeota archaeon]